MPAKPNTRNWNDVQTAIAAMAVVGTLALWNVFATPSEKVSAASDQPVVIPPAEPPATETPVVVMPQVKIMFTQTAPQTTVIQQIQPTQQKKKNKNNNNNNDGGSVTQTRTS